MIMITADMGNSIFGSMSYAVGTLFKFRLGDNPNAVMGSMFHDKQIVQYGGNGGNGEMLFTTNLFTAEDLSPLLAGQWVELVTAIPEEIRLKTVDVLVDIDMNTIREGFFSTHEDTGFLDSVLKGSGWIPYNMLTDEQLLSEILERELELEDHIEVQKQVREWVNGKD